MSKTVCCTKLVDHIRLANFLSVSCESVKLFLTKMVLNIGILSHQCRLSVNNQ